MRPSSELIKIVLPTDTSVTQVARALSRMSGFVWLDSGSIEGDDSRYHVLSCNPCAALKVASDGSLVLSGDALVGGGHDDAITIIEQTLSSLAIGECDEPFTGGMMGYCSYDYGMQRVIGEETGVGQYLMEYGLYLWAIVSDQKEGLRYLVIHPECPDKKSVVSLVLSSVERGSDEQVPPFSFSGLSCDMNRSDYEKRFQRIKSYLIDGDVYQVNFARCYQAQLKGNPFDAYLMLRDRYPAPFGAYFRGESVNILCNSPERFMQCSANKVTTQPIKGTRPRSDVAAEDERLKQELFHSEKDRAENVMIVDLMRNDLGLHSQVGTVTTERLFEVKSFPTVHHLMSTVSARLKSGISAPRVFLDAMPGGSVTGAPKKRAMEVIRELETKNRGIYCGSLMYFSTNKRSDSNIFIRTAIETNGSLEFWSGGGVVCDSTCDAEYLETVNKARAFLSLVESNTQQ